MRWFRLAAEQGDASASNYWGIIYMDGAGVPKDAVAAHMWFSFASANGYDSAGSARNTIETSMTPEQIAEATRLARVCSGSSYADCP